MNYIKKKIDKVEENKKEDTTQFGFNEKTGKLKMTLEEATQYIIDNPPPYD